MTVLFALLLIVVLLAGWLLTLLGMPGNWLIVAATAVYAFLTQASSHAIGWKVVAILVVLAALGELLELIAGATGAARAGGSRRAAILALLGSIVGASFGILAGLPIPLAGPIVGALLFAGLGAMAGAMLGEIWAGRNLDASWQVGRAAFWGRLLGTLGKMLIGAMMVAVVLAALIF